MAPDAFPPQQQAQPGRESVMRPRPRYEPRFRGSGRLRNRVAIITGGDSGIGRAVAIAMAREGADVAIVYLEEHDDAAETARGIEAEGQSALLIAGDAGDEDFCRTAVQRAVDYFGHIDVVVNNAAEQHVVHGLEELTAHMVERTFRTNIFSYIFLAKAAVPHLAPGSAIINTASITAFKGNTKLIDYSATKGAIVALTRSLSDLLVPRGIRVNAVAPGPIWTPLIPASFDAEHVAEFGRDTPMRRAGQPNEVAPCFVFLACDDASYISGQVLHPNGGTIVM